MSRNTMKKWVGWIVVIVLVIVLVVLFYIFLKPKETYVSEGEETYKIDLLRCDTSNYKNAFFESGDAKKYTHEIQVTFKSDKMDKMYYSYEGEFDSDSAAESQSAAFHAKYNIYMSDRGLSQGVFDPRFSTVGDKLKISLVSEKGDLSIPSAVLFFLDSNDFQRLNSRSMSEMKKLYEGKGFKCKIQK